MPLLSMRRRLARLFRLGSQSKSKSKSGKPRVKRTVYTSSSGKKYHKRFSKRTGKYYRHYL